VTVTPGDALSASYSIEASVSPDGTWKALLKPAAAGGSHTVRARRGV
jgi:hypothetical protein